MFRKRDDALTLKGRIANLEGMISSLQNRGEFDSPEAKKRRLEAIFDSKIQVLENMLSTVLQERERAEIERKRFAAAVYDAIILSHKETKKKAAPRKKSSPKKA
jgi:hypothetical protein